MKHYALITGASSGLGTEFAKQLCEDGYSLILVARRLDRLEALKKELSSEGNDIQLITADLSITSSCEKVIEQLQDLPIDIFINNAGFGDCGLFSETELSKDLQMIDVNVKAMHTLMKLMLPKMHKQGYGSILNVASSAGLLPAGPYMATYYATKAYVASLTRAVAREEKERSSGIYIGALCPGPVDTEFNQVANVEFALRGITPSYCVSYALKKMKQKKTVIVPTFALKWATSMGRFIPQKLLIQITGHQQKKKIYRQ